MGETEPFLSGSIPTLVVSTYEGGTGPGDFIEGGTPSRPVSRSQKSPG